MDHAMRSVLALLVVLVWCSCAYETWKDFESARAKYDQCLEEHHGDERACEAERDEANRAYDAYEQDAADSWDCEETTAGCDPRGPAVDGYGAPR